MASCIEAVATSCKRGRVRGRGALHVTDVAAMACLERAGRRPGDLDLLVNAGLYKDANTAEPALATIVQEDLGANPTPRFANAHGTFAFDVLNGGCGVLTAAQLVDTFVAHGPAKRAMIVAGDVDPSPRTSRNFPFSPAAGAMLIGHVPGPTGFQAFAFRTFPAYAGLFEATLHWEPRAGWLRRGRNIVDVYEAPEFGTRCLELATKVASSFLAQHGLVPDDIDLLITSQYPRAIPTNLAGALGIRIACVPPVAPMLERAHTAGPIAALEAARDHLARARRTLFVTVGAGITVGVALYVNAAS
jgi:3-oxoacyl-[acyl-carrier-protein] synthase-3